MNIAIVTGASSGLGREFVKKLYEEQKYDQIWIIARRRDRLLEIELKYGKKIVPIDLDLTDKADLLKYHSLLIDKKPNVCMLVNCAGFGKFGTYEQINVDDSLNMIDLNCKALVYLSETTIPFMSRGSKIVEIDSIAAFQPIPYLNVYGATKSFVLSYTLALGEELKKKGIKTFAVCPGWIKTEFFDKSGNDNGAVTYFNKWFTADEVATYAMRKIAKGKKTIIIPSVKNKLQVLLVKFSSKKFIMNMWLKQQKHK